jgi:LysM repeat protein
MIMARIFQRAILITQTRMKRGSRAMVNNVNSSNASPSIADRLGITGTAGDVIDAIAEVTGLDKLLGGDDALNQLNAKPDTLQRFAPTTGGKHIVKRGDTLDSIARANGTTWQALKALNPQISNPNLIRPGQKITLPADAMQNYNVRAGDTLSAIATRFGTTPQAIKAANPTVVENVNRIYPGEELRIPGGVGATNGARAQAPDAKAPVGAVKPSPTTNDAPEVHSANHRLGSLSEVYESGGRGPGTVSNGKNDSGGASYGVYQLSSAKGTLGAFMRNEGSRWAAELKGLSPGSDAFNDKWRKIAGREPQAFRDAQHAFIERTHFKPAVTKVLNSTQLDLNSRHNAVRDAVWSVSVQHGGAETILTRAVSATDKQLSRNDTGYDRALVENIYSERTRYTLAVANDYSNKLKPGERAQLIEITKNRFVKERQDALAMLSNSLPQRPRKTRTDHITSATISQSNAAFINPTGQAIRNDGGGHGHFGASRVRDGRVGKHEGLDILSTTGQAVKAPISGTLYKSNPQEVHSGFKIVSDDGKTIVKVFYAKFDPSLEGTRVKAGDDVAVAQDLQMKNKYPKHVKDHVHVEVIQNGVKIDPAPLFFPK